MDLEKILREKHPSISASSVKTYSSTLRGILKQVFPKESPSLDLFQNAQTILLHYDDSPLQTKLNKLNALFSITGNELYRTEMLKTHELKRAETSKQVKNEKQQECSLEQSQLKELWTTLKTAADHIYKKKDRTDDDLQILQQFILLSLMGGIFIPPRRSMDYCFFKIKNPDDNFNYLFKNKLVFNKYKTVKTYGRQEVAIPKELKSILTKWIKNNPTEWLLFDTKRQPLTAVKINQRFEKLFGKKCSVNSLRHSYLTDKYSEHIPMRREMEQDFKDMGSSMANEHTYVQLEDVD
jgi:hypothetical protein